MILVLLPALKRKIDKNIISKLIEELNKIDQVCKILLCDDGSKDHTVSEVRNSHLKLISK